MTVLLIRRVLECLLKWMLQFLFFWVEDMLKQKVTYDWTPPFCQQCKKVGHDCAQPKPKSKGPQTKKVWVPKAKPVPDNVEVTQGPIITTSVVTPNVQPPPVTEDNEAGWILVVTRKSREGHVGEGTATHKSFSILSTSMGGEEGLEEGSAPEPSGSLYLT